MSAHRNNNNRRSLIELGIVLEVPIGSETRRIPSTVPSGMPLLLKAQHYAQRSAGQRIRCSYTRTRHASR